MTTDIARRDTPGALTTDPSTTAVDSFKILDVYAGGVANEAPRSEALATMSAGERVYQAPGKQWSRSPTEVDKIGRPTRSRDGTIVLHDRMDRGAGLRTALAARQFRALTIAFPLNDPSAFIKCRFTKYTTSELKAFGDDTHLMVLGPRGYRRVESGTDEYARELAGCKVSVSVYFCLAEWGPAVWEIVFPDGFMAWYRLRFTSRHSLRSVLAGIRDVMKFTGGKVAGVPFDLSLDYREVAGPDGKKRTIPVWVIVPKPPETFRLSSANFQQVMTRALRQGEQLMLAAPPIPEPTFDEAAAEGADVDLDDEVIEGAVLGEPSDEQVGRMARGGTCDARLYEGQFFGIVGPNSLREPDGRAAFLREYTRGLRPALRTDSLAAFLARATDREATELMVAVNDHTVREIEARRERAEPPPAREPDGPTAGRRYRDLFPDDEEDPVGPAAGAADLAPEAADAGTAVAEDGAVEGEDVATRRTVGDAVRERASARRVVVDGVVVNDDDGPVGRSVDVEPTGDDNVRAAAMVTGAPIRPTAHEIIARAGEDPQPRPRLDRWYATLASIARARNHAKAEQVNAKKAGDLDDETIVESIRVLLTWFPDVTVEALDTGQVPF